MQFIFVQCIYESYFYKWLMNHDVGSHFQKTLKVRVKLQTLEVSMKYEFKVLKKENITGFISFVFISSDMKTL